MKRAKYKRYITAVVLFVILAIILTARTPMPL